MRLELYYTIDDIIRWIRQLYLFDYCLLHDNEVLSKEDGERRLRMNLYSFTNLYSIASKEAKRPLLQFVACCSDSHPREKDHSCLIPAQIICSSDTFSAEDKAIACKLFSEVKKRLQKDCVYGAYDEKTKWKCYRTDSYRLLQKRYEETETQKRLPPGFLRLLFTCEFHDIFLDRIRSFCEMNGIEVIEPLYQTIAFEDHELEELQVRFLYDRLLLGFEDFISSVNCLVGSNTRPNNHISISSTFIETPSIRSRYFNRMAIAKASLFYRNR